MELRIEQRSVWNLSPKTAVGASLTLEPGEVIKLSPRPGGFHVLSGIAWVSWRGEDIILYPGETIRFAPGGGSPVVSAARRLRLTIELLD
ncbi:MAG: hypothetical protein JNL34_16910 [Anaerolineae bacterium]|nr:hypothetical protein [Anaerolineae bacterium]